jgi:N-acyl homoserine lactone hydrolase
VTSPAAAEISCFSTGAVRTKRRRRGVRRYLPGGWRPDVLPVHVFLVRHPEGICLFDAGQSARAATAGYFPKWYPFFRLARFELGPEDEVTAKLRLLGTPSEGIRWVVLSHMHTDHVGGLDGLRGPEVMVSQTEWQRSTGVGGRLRGYLPQYWPKGVVPRLIDFNGPKVGPFQRSSPLTSDGRLALVPTPGHTPGHMSLFIDAGPRRFLLAGDLCESADRLAEVEPELADRFAREGIVVLSTHDPLAPTLLADAT